MKNLIDLLFEKIVTILILTIAGLFCCISCSGLNGSGTGVGNGVIIGKVIHSDSTPVKNAVVRLRSETFLADTSGIISTNRTDTTVNLLTDTSGIFIIDSVKMHHSSWIEVLDNCGQGKKGTLYRLDYDTTQEHDTIFLGTHIMEPLKELQGRIVLFGLPQNAYVLIYGLERICKTDSLGQFVITDLPVGDCEDNECEYKMMVFAPDINMNLIPHEYELEIEHDTADSIIRIELELSDTLDADDFVPLITCTDSSVIAKGFPSGTVLTFTDNSTRTATDSTMSIVINQLQSDQCIADTCLYTFNASIPESTGLMQINSYTIKTVGNNKSILDVSIRLNDD